MLNWPTVEEALRTGRIIHAPNLGFSWHIPCNCGPLLKCDHHSGPLQRTAVPAPSPGPGTRLHPSLARFSAGRQASKKTGAEAVDARGCGIDGSG